jgi:hypothetical protein
VSSGAGGEDPSGLRQRVAELLSPEAGAPVTVYEEATVEAATAVAVYLAGHPKEPLGDTSRHAEDDDSLYVRVQKESGALDKLRLSSLMWSRAVEAALSVTGHSD